MKRVSETAAGKSISAYVVMKGARHVATVQLHYADGGTVTANVWQEPEAYRRSYAASAERDTIDDRRAYDQFALQGGTARGGGYDKKTAALRGLWIDGHVLTDHADPAGMKPPRGMKFYPADWSPPKGFSTANHGYFDRVTGERRPSYYWTDQAKAELGDDADWDAVKVRARQLEAAANLVSGYSSCFREPGLKYLEAIGYSVIQAL